MCYLLEFKTTPNVCDIVFVKDGTHLCVFLNNPLTQFFYKISYSSITLFNKINGVNSFTCSK